MSEIARELMRRARTDKKMRNDAMVGKVSWDERIDRENTEFLRKVVEMHGWPTKSSVGDEAAAAAWLLAQHADHDPTFQAHCLKLMKALPNTEVSITDIAYLEDRVRVNYSQPQLYGTQFYEQGDLFGPRPIEAAELLDKRRAAVGLEPFKKYEAKMHELQKNKSSGLE